MGELRKGLNVFGPNEKTPVEICNKKSVCSSITLIQGVSKKRNTFDLEYLKDGTIKFIFINYFPKRT